MWAAELWAEPVTREHTDVGMHQWQQEQAHPQLQQQTQQGQPNMQSFVVQSLLETIGQLAAMIALVHPESLSDNFAGHELPGFPKEPRHASNEEVLAYTRRLLFWASTTLESSRRLFLRKRAAIAHAVRRGMAATALAYILKAKASDQILR